MIGWPGMNDFLYIARYFAFVAISALTISLIGSLIVFQVGIPADVLSFIRLNLIVTSLVGMPIAVLASLQEYQSLVYQRRLEAMAWTDSLTGLLNRRFFKVAAEEERVRMRRTGTTAAVILFDLDNFKSVNDTMGHAVGDRILKEVAQLAHTELRGPFDRLGRWGGEEFIILLSHVKNEQAQLVCERLRSRIEQQNFETGAGQINITASFGAAILGAGDDLAEVIEAADAALYSAKRTGRNCILLSPREPVTGSLAPARLDSYRRALAANDDEPAPTRRKASR